MKTYTISFRYSRNGISWTSASTSVKAETQSDAMAIIESKYPIVANMKIISVR